MPTDYVDPNDDVSNAWVVSGGGDAYDNLDDGVRQPDEPDADYIFAGDGNENDECIMRMGTLTDVDTVSSIVIWTYGKATSGERPTIDININGYQGVQTVLLDTSYSWKSNTFNGNWTQSQLNDLLVKYKADTAYGKYDSTYIKACYGEITYTELVSNWAHKFIGVAGASIGKVCGVEIGNIGSVKGVEM